MRHPDIFAGVLVGGRGTRLGGVDKARLRRADGRSYLEHVVAELRPKVAALRLAGRAGQAYPEVDAPLVVNRLPDQGPLGALDALLRQPPAPWCLLVACDMPAFSGELVDLLAAGRFPAAMAVLPRAGDRLHPACALYAAALAPQVEAQLAAGARSLRALAACAGAVVIDVPAGLAGALANVNAPGDA